jgi:hypothetical protein
MKGLTQKIKHTKIINNMVDKGWTASKSILEEGYSPAIAHNPYKITATKSFKELLEEKLSDKSVVGVHQEIMNNKKAGSATRLNAVKLAYQVKGKLIPEESSNQTTYNIVYEAQPPVTPVVDIPIINVIGSDKAKEPLSSVTSPNPEL